MFGFNNPEAVAITVCAESDAKAAVVASIRNITLLGHSLQDARGDTEEYA